ncbi:hypothetical protein R1T16_06220 [Flavobacterium sp. DG1-102-2]|uniref:hypothetical protein n=1 Tax=Flavobacterium sp. DG1-102-2 TaxID=3081663 RepID=UPI002949B6F6|nr:hypothetical protein [Flavobacterium sp. DG1-102-2]MDV6168012.1 hypothetical protein [Flavobacterium sp. DG1-102-2]
MISGTDDPKDLGAQKMNNQEKPGDKNEGFSGENLPKNYDPSTGKLKTEQDKDTNGDTETVKRARDVDEKKAANVSQGDKATRDGETVSKSRGTTSEKEDVETAENRDFNSDTEEDRYPASHPDNKKQRGNINPGK